MKVVKRTGEYTIYQKRSERYAVRDAARAWINGDAKVAILLEHKLIEAPKAKAPEPVPAAEETAGAEAEAAEGGSEEAPAAE
ncbi:MAG: hypothetical protein R3E86_04665 [Pseudomonadales bacterium]